MPVIGSHFRAAVIPAKAGIHSEIPENELPAQWIPAFAGMTGVGGALAGRHEAGRHLS